MKLRKINRKFLNKLDNIISNKERVVNEKYQGRCDRDVFINRLFLPLSKSTYVIRHKNEIYYVLLYGGTVKSNNYPDNPYKVGPIRYYLGYKTLELEVQCLDEKGSTKSFKLDHNDLVDLRFKKISLDQYYKVLKLFSYSEPLQKFKCKLYDLNKENPKAEFITEFGKSFKEIQDRFPDENVLLYSIGEPTDATKKEIELFNSTQNG